MNSDNGWIMPDGRYIECKFEGHIKCAKEQLGLEERELEKTAIKVSCLPSHIRCHFYSGKEGDEYKPNFKTLRDKWTKAQIKTIKRWCLRFGFKPPLDYFLQTDLDDLYDLSTKQILSILSKEER